MTSHQATELESTIGLSYIRGIGPMRFRVLYKFFGSAKNIYYAKRQDLVSTGLSRTVADNIIAFRQSDKLTQALTVIQSKGITVLTQADIHYPEVLKNFEDAPFVLYALGNTALLVKQLHIAIVGTRKPTPYGVSVTKSLSADLSASDITVVSGMAMGIDGIAHKYALTGNGSTIAVLGSGVDTCYPLINKGLYHEIIDDGLVISEFPPGTKSAKGHFPARNRIVAALSAGLVVVEGTKHSGSLITARFASEYGKDPFAVPGPVTSPQSDASLYLLQNGAHAISSGADIASFYKKEALPNRSLDDIKKSISPKQWEIVTVLKESGRTHIDEIARSVDIDASLASSELSMLELKGIVTQTDNNSYTLV